MSDTNTPSLTPPSSNEPQPTQPHVSPDPAATTPPPSPTADQRREQMEWLWVLLGIQNGLIARARFVAWWKTLPTSTPVAFRQALIDAGLVTADDRQLLDALCRKYLELHHRDPQRCLADLSSLGSLRQELEQHASPQVLATLAYVGTNEHTSNGTAQSRTGSRFRILKPHARGGLGEVFLAKDEELDRDVALKEIQARYGDHAESRARFLKEAEITGKLEHPGIVPVYGLGTYADGRPYYAMRFIQGDSLQDAIERFHDPNRKWKDQGERELEFRKLLQRFIDVCNAIEYAHSRGILHRDLKPGNIMLGQYGETLVVDWGLAKQLGDKTPDAAKTSSTFVPTANDDSGLTQYGQAIGTPAFMSPEQAAGRLDELGPATDVYSLGATLYSVLTGKPPFSAGSAIQIIEDVCNGLPVTRFPRIVNRSVPKALQAICLRAMSKDAIVRYPSAKKLAEDIERWLVDEKVSAHRATITERSLRWIRRHPRLGVGIGAIAMTAIVSFSVAAYFATRFIHRERVAMAQEEKIAAERRSQAFQEEGRVLNTRRAEIAAQEKSRIDLILEPGDAIQKNDYFKEIGSALGFREIYVYRWKEGLIDAVIRPNLTSAPVSLIEPLWKALQEDEQASFPNDPRTGTFDGLKGTLVVAIGKSVIAGKPDTYSAIAYVELERHHDRSWFGVSSRQTFEVDKHDGGSFGDGRVSFFYKNDKQRLEFLVLKWFAKPPK